MGYTKLGFSFISIEKMSGLGVPPDHLVCEVPLNDGMCYVTIANAYINDSTNLINVGFFPVNAISPSNQNSITT